MKKSDINIDKDWLFQEYIIKNKSSYKIGLILNCPTYIVKNRLKKYGIVKKQYKKSIIGNKFCNLTALNVDIVKTKPGIIYWRCKCDCGNYTSVRLCYLIGHYTKSCGCLRHQSPPNKNFVGEISGKLWSSLKNKAQKRNLEFCITEKYAWELFLKQNRKCNLSGLDIYFVAKPSNGNRGIASLDRIDSLKGYIEGNVQWLHKDINWMKWDFEQNYFIELCSKVANFDINNVTEYPKIEECGYITNLYISSIKSRSKRNNILCKIDKDILWDLFLKQDGICILSGLPIKLTPISYTENKLPQTASIDRIIPFDGYIKNNIRWVHKHINKMKVDFSDTEFLNYCINIYKYKCEK